MFWTREKTSLYKTAFLGPITNQIRGDLKSINKFVSCVNIVLISRNSCDISSFFPYKDKEDHMLNSKVVYKISCGQCSASYIGKTYRHLAERLLEHNITSSNYKFSAVGDHCLQTGHSPLTLKHEILDRSSSDFKLRIKESLLIAKHKPSLNNMFSSTPLVLFNT